MMNEDNEDITFVVSNSLVKIDRIEVANVPVDVEDIKKVIKNLEKEWSVMFLNNEWWLVYSTEKNVSKKDYWKKKSYF